MSKPKPKRTKRYAGPKPVTLDPIGHSICGAALFMLEQRKQILAGPERGFNLLRQGCAKNEDWNEVSQALSVAEQLCKLSIGNNLLPKIEDAMTALSAVAVRMLQKNGPTTCYAAELSTIREGIDLYAIQVRLCTQGEFGRAVQHVKNWLTSSKTGTLDDYMEHVGKLQQKKAA